MYYAFIRIEALAVGNGGVFMFSLKKQGSLY